LEPASSHLLEASYQEGLLCLALDGLERCETLANHHWQGADAPYGVTAGFAWNADGLPLEGWVERLTIY